MHNNKQKHKQIYVVKPGKKIHCETSRVFALNCYGGFPLRVMEDLQLCFLKAGIHKSVMAKQSLEAK